MKIQASVSFNMTKKTASLHLYSNRMISFGFGLGYAFEVDAECKIQNCCKFEKEKTIEAFFTNVHWFF